MLNILKTILKIPATLCILTVRIVYQKGIGRLLPKVCIYEPSCSVYMVQALQTHGFFKGLLMGSWRILRCHPFARGGWDPVPGFDYDRYYRQMDEKEQKKNERFIQVYKENQIEEE